MEENEKGMAVRALYMDTKARLHRQNKHTELEQIVALAEEIQRAQDYAEVLHGRIEHLEHYIEVHAITAQDWINVYDRLPTSAGSYLVAAGDVILCAMWNPVENFWRSWPYGYKFDEGYITHWRPLPEPPTEV